MNSLRREIGYGIHLVRPPQGEHSQSESPGVNGGGQHMGRAFAADSHDGVALLQITEQKLEGTNLVSSALRSIEVIALDPQVRGDILKALDRRRQGAELRSRDAGESGERVEKRERFRSRLVSIQPFRLAE